MKQSAVRKLAKEKVVAEDLSKQLEATFNPQGVVKSYSFSSNFPEDMKTR